MSQRETQFYTRVHKALTPQVYRVKMHNAYAGGIADCWYSGVGGDLWVEYKCLEKLPARDSTLIKVDLSALQKEWLGQRYAEGRNVAVVVGVAGGGGVVMDNPDDWTADWTCAEFKTEMVPVKELAAWVEQQTT